MQASTELIVNSFKKEKFFDEQSAHELLTILIEERDLKDYVKKIVFDYSGNHQGVYDRDELAIGINLNNIDRDFFNTALTNDLAFSVDHFVKYFNMLIVNTIYHELEHAEQNRMISENINDDLLSLVAKESFLFSAKKDYNLRERFINKYYYKYLLVEKNAEAIALKRLLSDENLFSALNIDQIFTYSNILMNALLTGYKEGNSRIISGADYYYKLRGISKEYNKLFLDEKYDDITTLSWGLPIDKEKYNEIRDIKKNGVNSLKLILRK